METTKEYTWKLKGFGKSIDPDDAVEELKRITDVHGKLTPDVIVEEAAKPESPLHECFQWDDNKAAQQWRLQQARILINNIEVTIISSGEPLNVGAYEIVNKDDGYRHIETFTIDEMKVVKDAAIRDLVYVKKKLRAYDVFVKASENIQYAIAELQEA